MTQIVYSWLLILSLVLACALRNSLTFTTSLLALGTLLCPYLYHYHSTRPLVPDTLHTVFPSLAHGLNVHFMLLAHVVVLEREPIVRNDVSIARLPASCLPFSSIMVP